MSEAVIEAAFPEVLNDGHLRQFQEQGYLAFENVLTAQEVEAARAALTESPWVCCAIWPAAMVQLSR